MSKTFPTRALTIVTLAIVGGAILTANLPRQAPTHPVALPDLPSGLVVPAHLPGSLTDPAVLVAWIQLYNHTEPIELWDGRTLTGRELAQFLLDENIPTVWDVDGVCGGGSCSVHHWTWFGWVFEGQAPGVDPIYLRPALQTDPTGLLMVLAHEIFHRTQPFGAVADSRFEEYWGFRIGDAVAPASWPVFDGYDTLQSRDLQLWLRHNGLGAYQRLPDYPASVDGLHVSADEARPRLLSAEARLSIQAEAQLLLAAGSDEVAPAAVLPAWPGMGQ